MNGRVQGPIDTFERDLQREQNHYTEDQLKILQKAADILSVPVNNLHAGLAAATKDTNGSIAPPRFVHKSTRKILKPVSISDREPLERAAVDTFDDERLPELSQQFNQPLRTVVSDGGTKLFAELPSSLDFPKAQLISDATHAYIDGGLDMNTQPEQEFSNVHSNSQTAGSSAAASEVEPPLGPKKTDLSIKAFDNTFRREHAGPLAGQSTSLLQHGSTQSNSPRNCDWPRLSDPSDVLQLHPQNQRPYNTPTRHVSADWGPHASSTKATPQSLRIITTEVGRRISDTPLNGHLTIRATSSNPISDSSASGSSMTLSTNSDPIYPASTSHKIPEADGNSHRMVASRGPCSYVWELPPKVYYS